MATDEKDLLERLARERGLTPRTGRTAPGTGPGGAQDDPLAAAAQSRGLTPRTGPRRPTAAPEGPGLLSRGIDAVKGLAGRVRDAAGGISLEGDPAIQERQKELMAADRRRRGVNPNFDSPEGPATSRVRQGLTGLTGSLARGLAEAATISSSESNPGAQKAREWGRNVQTTLEERAAEIQRNRERPVTGGGPAGMPQPMGEVRTNPDSPVDKMGVVATQSAPLMLAPLAGPAGMAGLVLQGMGEVSSEMDRQGVRTTSAAGKLALPVLSGLYAAVERAGGPGGGALPGNILTRILVRGGEEGAEEIVQELIKTYGVQAIGGEGRPVREIAQDLRDQVGYAIVLGAGLSAPGAILETPVQLPEKQPSSRPAQPGTATATLETLIELKRTHPIAHQRIQEIARQIGAGEISPAVGQAQVARIMTAASRGEDLPELEVPSPAPPRTGSVVERARRGPEPSRAYQEETDRLRPGTTPEVVSRPAEAPADIPEAIPGGQEEERVARAAIRLPDGRVVEGQVHVEAYANAFGDDFDPDEIEGWEDIVSGFVTNRGRFLNTKEATELAGIGSFDGSVHGRDRPLESEDILYGSTPEQRWDELPEEELLRRMRETGPPRWEGAKEVATPPADPAESGSAAPSSTPPWAERRVRGSYGKPQMSVFPGDGRKVQTEYAVMDAGDLVASHTPSYSLRPPEEFPPEIQGRAYHGERGRQAREFTEQIVQGFDPERALDAGLSVADGPPTVTPSGVAVAGNGRIMVMQRLAGANPRAYEAYRLRLAQLAPQFGLDPKSIDSYREPVLVRVVTDGTVDPTNIDQLRELNASSDQASGKTKDVVSDAATRAARFREARASLSHLQETMPEDATIRSYLDSKDGREFLKKLVADGVIPQAERARFIDVTYGTPTDEGKLLLERVFYAAAIGDPDVVQAAPSGVLRKLDTALPAIIRADQVEGWEIGPIIRDALELHARARANGLTIQDELAQVDMTREPPSEEVARMALFLETAPKNTRGDQKGVKDALRQYAIEAEAAARQGQSDDLFGYEPRSAEEARGDLAALLPDRAVVPPRAQGGETEDRAVEVRQMAGFSSAEEAFAEIFRPASTTDQGGAVSPSERATTLPSSTATDQSRPSNRYVPGPPSRSSVAFSSLIEPPPSAQNLPEQKARREALVERYKQEVGALPEIREAYRQPSNDLGELLELAKEELPVYEAMLEEAIAGTPGASFISNIKTRESAERKLSSGGEWNTSPDRLTDLLRGSVLAESVGDLRAIAGRLVETGNVVELEDLFADPRPLGYAAIHALVKLPSGQIAEVQFHTPRLWEAKEIEGGHAVYVRARSADPSSVEEAQALEADAAAAYQMYSDAHEDALNGVPALEFNDDLFGSFRNRVRWVPSRKGYEVKVGDRTTFVPTYGEARRQLYRMHFAGPGARSSDSDVSPLVGRSQTERELEARMAAIEARVRQRGRISPRDREAYDEAEYSLRGLRGEGLSGRDAVRSRKRGEQTGLLEEGIGLDDQTLDIFAQDAPSPASPEFADRLAELVAEYDREAATQGGLFDDTPAFDNADFDFQSELADIRVAQRQGARLEDRDPDTGKTWAALLGEAEDRYTEAKGITSFEVPDHFTRDIQRIMGAEREAQNGRPELTRAEQPRREILGVPVQTPPGTTPEQMAELEEAVKRAREGGYRRWAIDSTIKPKMSGGGGASGVFYSADFPAEWDALKIRMELGYRHGDQGWTVEPARFQEWVAEGTKKRKPHFKDGAEVPVGHAGWFRPWDVGDTAIHWKESDDLLELGETATAAGQGELLDRNAGGADQLEMLPLAPRKRIREPALEDDTPPAEQIKELHKLIGFAMMAGNMNAANRLRSRVRELQRGMPEGNGDVSPLSAATTREVERLPNVGTYSMVGDSKEAPRPSQIVRELTEALDKALQGVKVREGRVPTVRMHGTTVKPLGTFNSKTQVVRTVNLSDLRIFGHEAGHAMQQVIRGGGQPGQLSSAAFDTLPGAVRGELEDLGENISDGSPKEGWAEFWRYYLDNPDFLERHAPNTLQWVEKEMKRHPTLKAAWDKARDEWTLHRDASPQARVRSHISRDDPPENLAILDHWRRFRTNILDDFEPLRALTQAIRDRGHAIETQEDVELLARLTRGSTGVAHHFIGEKPNWLTRTARKLTGQRTDEWIGGVKDFKTGDTVGPSLGEVIEPVKANLDDFRDYIVARRVQELNERNIGTGIRPEDAAWTVEELERRHGASFKKAFQGLQEYQDATLRYLRDSGVISRQSYAAIKELNENYVPFYRVTEGGKSGGRLGLGFGNLFSPVKRIKGSGKDIIDPLESIVKNTYVYTSLAAKQSVSNALASLAEKPGVGDLLEGLVTPMKPQSFELGEVSSQVDESLPGFSNILADLKKKAAEEYAGLIEGMDKDEIRDAVAKGLLPARPWDPHEDLLTIFRPGSLVGQKNTISVLRDGKRRFFEVDPELYSALEGLEREQLGMIGRLLAVPASLLRAGATMALEFQLRNPIRDQTMAFIQSEYGYVPYVDMAKGMFELVRKGEGYQDWIANGGERAALLSLDRTTMQNSVRKLTTSGGVMNVVKHPLDLLRAISALMEDATRVGEHMNAVKVEGTTKEGLQRAASASREISIDFARHGAKLTALRAITAFWNARLQGYDRLARAAKRNPGTFAVRAFAAITLPSLIEYAINRDDDDYWRQPQWQRDLFWMFKIGDQWVRIPKPFELGLIFGTLPVRILQTMESQGLAGELRQFFDETLFGEVESIVPMPTAVGPLLENLVNYSFFLDRPIVPRSEENVLPRYQGSEQTSEVARLMARWAPGREGISPRKIDNLLFSYTGGLGRMASEALDLAIPTEGESSDPAEGLAGVPGIRGIMAREPGFGSSSIEAFYRLLGDARAASRTVRFLESEERYDELEREQRDERGQALRSIESSLSRAADRIAEYRAQAEIIRRDDRLSPQEKRDQIQELGDAAMQEAESALSLMRDGG